MTVTLDLGKKIAEAVLFAAEEPLDLQTIQAHLPGDLHARDVIDALQRDYSERGVRLEDHGGRYALRTSPEIAPYLQRETVQSRRLSRAALETLAIIAYHQPITRAEIEDVRGVSTNKGTLDLLIETGWVRPKGRRETPGRPVTWVTTSDFLDHLDLSALDDLPRIEELLQVGLLGNTSATSQEEAHEEDADLADDIHLADNVHLVDDVDRTDPIDEANDARIDSDRDGEGEGDEEDRADMGDEPLEIRPGDDWRLANSSSGRSTDEAG